MGSGSVCMERTGTSRSCPSGPARQVAGRHVVGQPDAVGGLVEGVAGRVRGRGVHRQDDGRLAARAGRLKNDYKVTRKGNRDPRDAFENWLTDLLDNTIGKPALANVTVAFEEVDGHDVCRIDVRPGRQAVYARGKQTTDFYVRFNNSTRSLDVQEAVAYISAHDWARR